MTRDEVKKILFGQLEKIPMWKQSMEMTSQEIREEVKTKLEFKQIRDYLKIPGNALRLSVEEINQKWFEIFLFFVLDREDSKQCYFFGNDVLFDIPAQNKVMEIITDWGVYNVQSLTLEQFLKNSKEF